MNGAHSFTESSDCHESIASVIEAAARRQIELVMAQREEIARAFIAKYGFEPDRAIQIHQRMPDGTERWFIRRMTDEEMLAASMMGAQL